MTTSDILQCQNEIVTTLSNAVRQPWRFVVVNIEIDEIDGEQTENCMVLSYTRRFWKLVRKSETLPYRCYDQFSLLRTLMSANQDIPWQSCTLVINNAGKYRFAFKYDTPLRLNGNHGEDSMLTNFDPKSFLNASTK